MRKKRVVLLIACVIMVFSTLLFLTGCKYYGFYYVSNAIDKMTYNAGNEMGYNVTKLLFSFEWGEWLIQFVTGWIRDIWLWIFH